jgi:pimeloyl-ACP methyl ester carboxylesterase
MLPAFRSLTTFSRRGVLALLAAVAVFGLAAAHPASAAAASAAGTGFPPAVTCQQDIRVPVALAAGHRASEVISGELCSIWAEQQPGSTVQLLIPGATYTHDYWDFGAVDGVTYSYARSVAAEGFPAFAIDPLGTGASSHPLSTQLTAQAETYVAHQLVQALRGEQVAGIRFGKVIDVGHSPNSLVVWDEAIGNHDVNGIIVTGAAHSLAAAFGAAIGTDFYPAVKDTKFAGSGLDSGYLTTVLGTRGALFYHLPDADPAVIALDETRKDVVSGTELNTAVPVVLSTATRAIDVPVLDILGSNDLTTCGLSTTGATFDCSSGTAVAAQEAPFYSPQAQLRACVIPGSGHDVSLALNHGLQIADAVAWSQAFVVQGRPGLPGNHHPYRHLPPNCS